METKQQIIILDGIEIPCITEGDKKYYPIRYVLKKFLIKTIIQLHKKEEFKNHIKSLVVDWSFRYTVPQESNCMSEEGWRLYLNSSIKNRNRNELKTKRFNLWCDYIGSSNLIETKVEPFDEYEQDCINNAISINPNIEMCKCARCNRELPMYKGFYATNTNYKTNYETVCLKCKNGSYSIYKDGEKDNTAYDVYKLFGLDGYREYKKNIKDFYIKYVHNNEFGYKLNINSAPNNQKEFIYDLLGYYYKAENLTKDDNIKDMINTLKIIYANSSCCRINDFIKYITKDDCKVRPYKYKKYILGNVNIEQAKIIIDNYLKDNNIKIDNIFEFDYSKLITECRMRGSFEPNVLDFVVKFYNYKYAAYKFKTTGSNYYKDINNRIFDMKWLIENDLKLDINKIPLYITKTFLSENYPSLYNVLNKGYYKGHLFEWINECYPNKFEESDFDITKYRMEFDSFEEAQVDRILREYLPNVIYNLRNSKGEFTLLDMNPDWIIPTEKGIYLCEYFGMYLTRGGQEYKERIKIYRDKTERKFERYKELEKVGYKTLFVFPEDLKENYTGLRNKLKEII